MRGLEDLMFARYEWSMSHVERGIYGASFITVWDDEGVSTTRAHDQTGTLRDERSWKQPWHAT